jgi:hypothetical protein
MTNRTVEWNKEENAGYQKKEFNKDTEILKKKQNKLKSQKWKIL